jgi:hypothetical protein
VVERVCHHVPSMYVTVVIPVQISEIEIKITFRVDSCSKTSWCMATFVLCRHESNQVSVAPIDDRRNLPLIVTVVVVAKVLDSFIFHHEDLRM